MADPTDQISLLDPETRARRQFRMRCFSPDDAKYGEVAEPLVDYLSCGAEWNMCAEVQRVLLETRVEFGKAEQRNLDELTAAIERFDPLNTSLLEDNVTRHDQLAVLEELGRYVSEKTKSLAHPGTTSYDILDTARAVLFKLAWTNVIRPQISKGISGLCEKAELALKEGGYLQTGRTHLQNTSPILFAGFLAGYAARLAKRFELCDGYFGNLKGKISGIVGTGASIDMVIGEGKSIEFEKTVLKKLGLEPDYTATQIVQKEALADVGHGLVSLMLVLNDFSNDIRLLYSSAIGEVTSRDSQESLGGSSADATKNNPINYENICGKSMVIESGMLILYDMIHSDLQRDLRNSVEGRYQPQLMMVETYESFDRLNKALKQLSINEDRMAENLKAVRRNPSEAMVAILRGEGWAHSKYGVGHDFVKKMGVKAQKEGMPLLQVCLKDPEFIEAYQKLTDLKISILNGKLEYYLGSAAERAKINMDETRFLLAYKVK